MTIFSIFSEYRISIALIILMLSVFTQVTQANEANKEVKEAKEVKEVKEVGVHSSPPEIPKSIQEAARKTLFGVDTVDEIRDLYKAMTEFQKTKAEPFRPKKINKRTIIVDTSVKAEIPKIYVFKGHNTTFTVIDSLGNPWPIQYVTPGNSTAYPVTTQPGIDHVVTLRADSKFIPSNITFLLQGKVEPVTFTLYSDGETVDYSVKLMVPGVSPSSDIVVNPSDVLNIPLINNPVVGRFLDDNPPLESVVIPLTGDHDTQAWAWKNKIVIRSREQIIDINNSVVHTARTPDKAWAVYFLTDPPPVLQMITRRGSVDYITLLYGEENYAEHIDNKDSGESFMESIEYSAGG